MGVTADRVVVELEAQNDKYNADVKTSVTVFEASMTKMERAAVKTEKRVGAAMTRTSKLTANQLLTIQYTVNDVIASLASGANPLTILAQQGGQVTQAFGGLGGTLRALAPFAFSAGGALTAFGVALGAAVLAAEKADAEFKALETSVVGLGRTTGLSAQGLRDLAAASADAGNVTRAAAEQMAISYANTGALGGQVIGKLITITDDYARATGQDAKKATEELGKAFADPARGAEMLQGKFGLLDAETLRLIRSMQASGETAQAQELLFERLGFTLDGQVPKVSGLKGWWDRLTKSISDAAAAARDYGKAQAEADQRQMARALGGVPVPTGEAERQANRAAMRRGSLARRNQEETDAAAIIDAVSLNDQRAKIQGKIDLLQKRVSAGGKDAAAAADAIKKLRKELADVGKGPKPPKPTKADEREALARREGRYADGDGPRLFTEAMIDYFNASLAPGQLERGNIDLNSRPVVKNADSSISTVRSMSIGTDRGETLIPTVSPDGRLLSDDEAIALFNDTGQQLGVFKDVKSATAYAKRLHDMQAAQYGGGVMFTDTVSTRDFEEANRVFQSRGGLTEALRNGGGDFKPAGQALAGADEDLKRYQDDLYDSTYQSIRGGLEAGFRNGLPGLLEYLGNQITRSLLDDLSKGLTEIFRSSGGWGGIAKSVGGLFGRANGGNMVGGVPYKINEGRPEVFVPPSSGKMVPVSRLVSRGSATISPVLRMSIDLSGANGDATIARIARQAAAQAGQAAYTQAMRDAPAALAKHQGNKG